MEWAIVLLLAIVAGLMFRKLETIRTRNAVKVVKHGKYHPEERTRDAWTGHQIKCDGCGCVFEITEGTPLKIGKTEVSGYFAEGLKCPECARALRINWRDLL